MKMKVFQGVLFLMVLLAAGLQLASCSDDDPTTPPAGSDENDDNVSPPLVVAFDPAPSEVDVDLDQEVSIYFSEPMDTVGTAGKVTLSHGTISGFEWDSENTRLGIEHTAWPEDTAVTVTVPVTFQDIADNPLAEPVTNSFLTFASDFRLLESLPAAGDVDVLTNSPIGLRFNKSPATAGLRDYIVVSTPDKVSHPFNIGDLLDNGYRYLIPTDPLPANTEVTVTIYADLQSSSGVTFGENQSYSFTTGATGDTTIPTLVSFEPASGSTISIYDNVLTLTFSEPIDEDDPALLGADMHTVLGLELGGGTQWNEDYTVFTVIFVGPLTPGVELTLTFGDFTDIYGNTNTSHPAWTATVMGTPDLFPVQEKYAQGFDVLWHGSNPVKDVPGGTFTRWRHFEWEVPGSDFRWYTGDEYLRTELTEWDYMTKSSSAIMLRGFREEDEGTPTDKMFDSPVKYLTHPLVTANWDGSTQIDMGEDTADIDFSVTVLDGLEDLPLNVTGPAKGFRLTKMDNVGNPEFFWPNCRKVILTHELSVSGELVEAGADTSWYCPGFGLVKFSNWIQESEDGYQEWEEGFFAQFHFFDEH